MDVSLIYCTILLNLDLKSQHQFNDRLFRFFYPHGLLNKLIRYGQLLELIELKPP
ncbi:hypothetical protein E1A91_A10G129100v1 [Gossypium mustelinum]|uniref:Uncharacterized protein n=1 Tax=Gossypium mustelinum TaxID=34275 RepID=A0A5D2XKS7_GOSMU|nr:hypothetical protein E1A91_A10G129100v1 [Gossypium mustelinum]